MGGRSYTDVGFKNETKEAKEMCEKVVFDYSKLKGRIVEKFGTQGRFAAANQLTDRSMSLKLNNGIGLSQEEVLKWCKMLDIDIMDIPDYFFKQKVSNFKHKVNKEERRNERNRINQNRKQRKVV